MSRSKILLEEWLLIYFLFMARIYYRLLIYISIFFRLLQKGNKLRKLFEFKTVVFLLPESAEKSIKDHKLGNINFELFASCVDQIKTGNTLILYYSRDLVVDDLKMQNCVDNILFVSFFDSNIKNLQNVDGTNFSKKYNDIQKYHFLLIDLDFVHPLHQYQYIKIFNLLGNCSLMAIDIKPNWYLRNFFNCFGPRPLPYSASSVKIMRSKTFRTREIKEVAFIGTLYENRVKYLKKIEKNGVIVLVNPHKLTPEAELRSLPDYETYLGHLSQYEIHLNLALNSRERSYQIKSRLMELSIVGNKILSDGIHVAPTFIRTSGAVINLNPLRDLKERIYSFIKKNTVDQQIQLSNSAIKFNSEFWEYVLFNISNKS